MPAGDEGTDRFARLAGRDIRFLAPSRLAIPDIYDTTDEEFFEGACAAIQLARELLKSGRRDAETLLEVFTAVEEAALLAQETSPAFRRQRPEWQPALTAALADLGTLQTRLRDASAETAAQVFAEAWRIVQTVVAVERRE